MKPYIVMSDLHGHNWSAFSTINSDGINSRLQTIIDEVKRAAQVLRAAGGNHIYLGGDTFHVRGSVDPTVFNPFKNMTAELYADDFTTRAIAGNHDLGAADSEELSNAAQSLCVNMVSNKDGQIFEDDKVVMIPWHKNLDELRAQAITKLSATRVSEYSLIIHAPLNDVIYGIPNHGLDAQEVASWGYKRVFCGHYHNHKDFGNGVYSIGATTHQTWNDVGSKAGFLLVTDDEVKFYASHAPKFVEIDEDNFADAALLADGNYVRAMMKVSKESEVAGLRKYFMNECGAKGVIITQIKESAVTRPGVVTTASQNKSLGQWVGDYMTHKTVEKEHQGYCMEILNKVGG